MLIFNIIGTFGVVYRGLYTRNDEIIEVAIKTLKGVVAPLRM